MNFVILIIARTENTISVKLSSKCKFLENRSYAKYYPLMRECAGI